MKWNLYKRFDVLKPSFDASLSNACFRKNLSRETQEIGEDVSFANIETIERVEEDSCVFSLGGVSMGNQRRIRVSFISENLSLIVAIIKPSKHQSQ